MRGRPPLAPRIEALEKRVAELEQQLFLYRTVTMEHEKQLVDMLNKQHREYVPRFEHWPGNGG